jgi:hypothetical protein
VRFLSRLFNGRRSRSGNIWRAIRIDSLAGPQAWDIPELGLECALQINPNGQNRIIFLGSLSLVGNVIQYVIAPDTSARDRPSVGQISGYVLMLPWDSDEGTVSAAGMNLPRDPRLWVAPLLLCVAIDDKVEITA